jgi:hypothetical protein
MLLHALATGDTTSLDIYAKLPDFNVDQWLVRAAPEDPQAICWSIPSMRDGGAVSEGLTSHPASVRGNVRGAC